MRRLLSIATIMLAAAMGLVPAPSVRAQQDASLREHIKARQQLEATSLKAQHKLEKDSAKGQHLSKTQKKQLRRSMRRENRQMRRAHKAQWSDLKARGRWNKQHEKEQSATPNR